MSKNWTGWQSTKARRYWQPRLPLPCCRCGRPVMPDSQWQVDHWPIPREFGGTETWPAHSLCNMSAGGKRGAEITNARKLEAKQLERMPSERERRIRGR